MSRLREVSGENYPPPFYATQASNRRFEGLDKDRTMSKNYSRNPLTVSGVM